MEPPIDLSVEDDASSSPSSPSRFSQLSLARIGAIRRAVCSARPSPAMDPPLLSIFDRVLGAWPEFTPIPNCPGRFVLKQKERKNLDMTDIYPKAELRRIETAMTRDATFIAPFADKSGALMTYEKPDGFKIHTLSNWSGFERKLAMLGADEQTM